MTTPHSAAPERSVVDRTLSILGAFDRDNPTLTLSDISRRAGLPLATVHRIVSKLHSWGALERCADGMYSIGLRLWETAVLAPRSSALVEAAQPHLIALHGQTSGAAVIAIRDGGESVCLSFVSDDPEFPNRYSPQGCRVSLHATSVGLVLLAHADQLLQSEVCGGPLHAYTPRSLTDGAALQRLLGRIRREGHAAVHGTLTEARGGYAVPVRDGRGVVVAAVAVVGPPDLVRPARLAHHVHAAANAISQSLRALRSGAAEVGA
ncbi:IclR family transcriptional regulator [Streptomyces sp. NPDC001401]|uniref:IclR family transcriptional regulator n=1 Tax=Streptomyces sp. NPDC001401 TaxID=3364570 RepID=UPI0036B1D475